MAYNSYFPTGYQPMYYPTQANTYPTQANVGPTQPTQNGIIWVQGEAAAKSYPVAPNSSVPLWDSEANVIYIKSADMSGMPSIKVLDYTMRDISPRTSEIAAQSDFATKDDVEFLKGEITALKSKFESMSERKEGNNAE